MEQPHCKAPGGIIVETRHLKLNNMKVSLKPLNRQVIVITGASSGIGLVTARMAAK